MQDQAALIRDPSGISYRFPDVIDSTILACADSCWQRFFHEYILCLSSSVISPDLHAGGAFARGIEVARRAYWFEKLSPPDAIFAGFKAFMLQWGAEFEPAPKRDGTPHPKDFVNTAGAYFDYFRQYSLDSDPIQPYIMSGNRPAIEFSFAIPLPIKHPITGNPLLYGGRMDMIGYYQSFLAIIDEKTTSQLGMNWERKWPMRGQFKGYAWAAQQHGVPAKAAVIRGIAIQKTQYSHLQAITQIQDWQIAEWHADMLSKVQEMVERFEAWQQQLNRGMDAIPHAARPWRKSWADACESYGGCQFLDLCISRDPTIWYDTFQRRIWNPLNRVPVSEAKVDESAQSANS